MSEEAKEWLRVYEKDRRFGPYPPSVADLAFADWAGGKISDALYTELTGYPAKTEFL